MKHYKDEAPLSSGSNKALDTLKRIQAKAVKQYKPKCLACGDMRGKNVITEQGSTWEFCSACQIKDDNQEKRVGKFTTKRGTF